MRSNFHTHTVYCDGKSTPEEVILTAIEKGFSAIGFSGHAKTDFSCNYCMQDTDRYIAELRALAQQYRDRITVLVGVEEDAASPIDRSGFDYIIGSSHYLFVDGKPLPIDSNPACFAECLAAFDHDVLRLAEQYYSNFCRYLLQRRPDIIGHFDLITKFDEMGESLFLENPAYRSLAARYIAEAAKAECLFEVNTGAISRGFRTTPYPSADLLRVLLRCDARLILSSDSHSAETLDHSFDEATALLRDIGFDRLYTLTADGPVSYRI